MVQAIPCSYESWDNESAKFKSWNLKACTERNQYIDGKCDFDAEEIQYVTNPWKHVDFVLYHKLDKMPILVIEVDGYDYHKKGTVQHERGIVKNAIISIQHTIYATVYNGEYGKRTTFNKTE